MKHEPTPPPWRPKWLSVAIFDSDAYLADVLCGLLRDQGLVATAFDDAASLMRSHQAEMFDAYVLDQLADWSSQADGLKRLVASIRGEGENDTPVFILGNQVAPERTEPLASILMRYKVRYLLRPVRVAYVAQQLHAELAKKIGL